MEHSLANYEPTAADTIHVQQKALDEKAQIFRRLHLEIGRLRIINAELLEVLKTVEWVETNKLLAGSGGNYEARCPWCGALGQNPLHWWEHEPDCPRQAAIAKAKGD